MINFKDSYNGLVAFNPNWVCELDEKEVELALHIEIIDMKEATGEKEYEQYPFLVSISVIAANPHESFNEDEANKATQMSLIEDCMSYMGGVPIDHKFIETDRLNQDITGNLKAKEAMLITIASNFGTYAAQNGKGSKLTYPQFKTKSAAEIWAKQLVKLYSGSLMTLIGFTLDMPINMMGDIGWGVIEKQSNGLK